MTLEISESVLIAFVLLGLVWIAVHHRRAFFLTAGKRGLVCLISPEEDANDSGKGLPVQKRYNRKNGVNPINISLPGQVEQSSGEFDRISR